MLSFNVVDLLVLGNPDQITLSLPGGIWTLRQHIRYAESKAAMAEGKCAHTYIIEHPVALSDGAARVDRIFDELTPILLGASYASGLSVTIIAATMGSEINIMQPIEQWPRERAMRGGGGRFIDSASEFTALVERFAGAWPTAGKIEKASLLVHHWLDGLACR